VRLGICVTREEYARIEYGGLPVTCQSPQTHPGWVSQALTGRDLVLVIVQVSESQAESQAVPVNHRRRNYRNGSRISLVTARKFDWIAGS
jgi:hypothetical protein